MGTDFHKMKSNFNWYRANLAELYAEYGDCYLAIKDRQVIGTYPSYAEAVKETSKTEEHGTFNVQKCGPDESAYTVHCHNVPPKRGK